MGLQNCRQLETNEKRELEGEAPNAVAAGGGDLGRQELHAAAAA